ncbi:hypothetical protein F5Y03DRAFT_391636 [Xylaria venustula]|nr:hypothetical protein F5Y03DRAFT_391636 [Xylaria venustula]
MASPAKSTKKWDDKMNSQLFLSICEVLDLSFSQENKDAIVAMMTQRFGHNVNWNGIRRDSTFTEPALYFSSCTSFSHCIWEPLFSLRITTPPSYGFITPFCPFKMASGTKYTTWNGEVHQDIMMAMFETIQPYAEHFAQVAEKLRQKGYTFTAAALK